ncbi:MAG: hypothetical protein H7062_19595 [Candidatus Saccharimonas sp.]|nr:hypothetical protein [Planctomycetaceae bacterium]
MAAKSLARPDLSNTNFKSTASLGVHEFAAAGCFAAGWCSAAGAVGLAAYAGSQTI